MPDASPLECGACAAPASANLFDAHFGTLRRVQAQAESGCLSAAHALADVSRVLHDAVSAAATAFLLSPLPPPSIALRSLTYSAHSLQQSTEAFIRRLRAACILSVDDSRQADKVMALHARAAQTTAFDVRQERVAELISWLLAWLQRLSDNWRLHVSSASSSAVSVSASQVARAWETSAVLPAITSAAAANKPLSTWTEREWTLRCRPLWNTALLSLAQAEEDDNEREKAAEDERRDALAQVKQHEKAKREAARQQQRERLDKEQQKADRAADRAKRLEEGELDAEDAKKEEEDDEAKAREEEAAGEQDEEKEEELQVPPPVVRHSPLTFCCLGCHSALLGPAAIQRVHSNTVWSAKGAKVDALFRNMADVWEQEDEEDDAGRASADGEDDEADAAGTEQSHDSASQRRRSTTAAVHCARCFAYVGRWFVREEQYRLVHIDRLTGRNWLFVMGDEATMHFKLAPLLRGGEADADKAAEVEAEEDDEDDSGEKKAKAVKEEVIPAIVGLPTSYVSVAQAMQYPFPRFPVLAIAQTATAVNDNFPPLSPALVTALMSSSADPLFALSTASSAAALQLLLRSDPALHARALLLLVSRNVERVFSSFGSSAYGSPSACPVAAFTHFYLSPPQFTHARGTARYVFHFLTQRDDSRVKRQQWTVKRVRDAQRKAGELSALFVIAGGWGGMRAVVVKVAGAYRVLQSNELCRDKADRYTLTDWLAGNSRWSRVLDEDEWSEWLGKYERARRGERAVWEELFCRGRSVELLGCSQPQDSFKDSDCQFSVGKLLLDQLSVD